jgi:protease IV
MIVLELCQVAVVELSSPSPILPKVLSNLGNSLVGADQTLEELRQDLPFSDEVQARMDETMFQNLGGYPSANPILALMTDYLNSM